MKHTHVNRLLLHLRTNARKASAAIAREENIATSTIFDQLTLLEKQTIIIKHTSLIDNNKLGYPFRLAIYCTHTQTLINTLAQEEHTNNLLLLNNGKCYIDAIFKDIAEQDAYLNAIEREGASIEQTHSIISIVAEEQWLPGTA